MIPHLSKLEVMFVWKRWWLGLEKSGQVRTNQTQDRKQVYYLYNKDRHLFFCYLPIIPADDFFVMCNGKLYQSSNDNSRRSIDIYKYGRR